MSSPVMRDFHIVPPCMSIREANREIGRLKIKNDCVLREAARWKYQQWFENPMFIMGEKVWSRERQNRLALTDRVEQLAMRIDKLIKEEVLHTNIKPDVMIYWSTGF